MSELKIAIIDPVGIKAGLDHYDISLAGALQSDNVKASVYSNFIDLPFAKHKHFKLVFRKSIFSAITFFIDLLIVLRKIRSERISIVILHLFHSSFADLLLMKVVRFFSLRICVILHDAESLISSSAKSKINSCLSEADWIIVHNKFTLDQLNPLIPEKTKKKISVVPHGHFLSLPVISDNSVTYKYFRLNENKKYLLFFGMIKKSKSLDLLLKALPLVDESLNLIIAGRIRDSDSDEIVSRINQPELNSRVTLVKRYITNEERNMLFNIADIVVLPYRRVYQSGILLMAMSYGKTVVASDLLPNAEIIGGENGYLFSNDNYLDLADKINFALSNTGMSMQRSSNGKKFVGQHHDWNIIAKKIKNIISN